MNKTPIRIQRKRTKGWKIPPNTIYVGRPSKYSNPFKVNGYTNHNGLPKKTLHRFATSDYASALFDGRLPYTVDDVKRDLAGKNLACWCGLDQECHADILLKIANEKANDYQIRKEL